MLYCESSSVGRASAFQAEFRRFEPGLSLKLKKYHAKRRDFLFLAQCRHAQSVISRSKKNRNNCFGFFYYLLFFNFFPKSNNNTIGTANSNTIVLCIEKISGNNNKVSANPPIAPPKCAE